MDSKTERRDHVKDFGIGLAEQPKNLDELRTQAKDLYQQLNRIINVSVNLRMDNPDGSFKGYTLTLLFLYEPAAIDETTNSGHLDVIISDLTEAIELHERWVNLNPEEQRVLCVKPVELDFRTLLISLGERSPSYEKIAALIRLVETDLDRRIITIKMSNEVGSQALIPYFPREQLLDLDKAFKRKMTLWFIEHYAEFAKAYLKAQNFQPIALTEDQAPKWKLF